MKETTLEQFSKEPRAFVDAAQQERVLVTRDGQPVALLVGLENKDQEDWSLETSPEFWRMIDERRRSATVPLEGIEQTLRED